MISLLFRASRKRPPPAWAFWQRAAADVQAWIPLYDRDAARARASADMDARGWAIERFEHVRVVDDEFPRDDWYVRWNVRRASQGTPVYNFFEPFAAYSDERGPPGPLTSRYLDTPGVSLDPARVPEALRPLLRFAKEWAIGDDVERSRFVRGAALADKKAFVDAVAPRFADIERYSRAHENSEPVPHEVVALNLMAEAADVASHQLEP